MQKKKQVFAILGSNQGHRAAQIRRAAFALADTDGIDLIRTSALYETEPWGRVDQAGYLNAAVELETTLNPIELLDRFQQIEKEIGRIYTSDRWAPRFIDIDIALYENEIIHHERLIVPHRHLPNRIFALTPLLEIAPDLVHPESGETLRSMLDHLLETEPAFCEKKQPIMRDIASMEEADFDWNRFREAESCPCRLFRSNAPEETERLSASWAKVLEGSEVFALAGKLGAGKTCFARGLARGLGVTEPVTSPSYVLVKSYEGRLMLHHADFYRLVGGMDGRAEVVGETQETVSESPDLTSLGLEDYLEDPEAVILIEWADRFPSWMEPPFYFVDLTGSGDGPRT
ncbi:MAG: 2-amino-4-hydroxy-6-hydroxymethyldihydropteridine diphosphokinase, partial [bacterium]